MSQRLDWEKEGRRRKVSERGSSTMEDDGMAPTGSWADRKRYMDDSGGFSRPESPDPRMAPGADKPKKKLRRAPPPKPKGGGKVGALDVKGALRKSGRVSFKADAPHITTMADALASAVLRNGGEFKARPHECAPGDGVQDAKPEQGSDDQGGQVRQGKVRVARGVWLVVDAGLVKKR